MTITLEIARTLDEELNLEAAREGVSPSELATLLIYLAQALLSEREPTPFQKAVREFLSSRSLDPHRVASVWEELVRFCVENPAESDLAPERDTLSEQGFRNVGALLKRWRNQTVHGGPGALSFGPSEFERPGNEHPGQKSTMISELGEEDRVKHVRSIRGKYAHVALTSEDLHRDRQTDERISERQLRGVEP